jgi:hypothetical protein
MPLETPFLNPAEGSHTLRGSARTNAIFLSAASYSGKVCNSSVSAEIGLHCRRATSFTVEAYSTKGVFHMSNTNQNSDKNQGQSGKNPNQGGQQNQGTKPGQGGQQNQGQRDNSGTGQQTGGDKSNPNRKEI